VLRSDADLAGSVQIVLSESGLLQYHDDYDAALGVLDEGLGQYPGDIDLHYARGLLLARLGDERLPDAEIAAHLIEVLWQLGEETSARDLMSDALTAHPDSDLLVALQDRIPGLVSDTAEGSTL